MPKSNFSYQIKTSIVDIIIEDWHAVVRDKNIYLSVEYLRALEQSMFPEIEFFYTILYNQKRQPVMVGVFQLVTFLYKNPDQTSLFLKHFPKDKDGNPSMNMLVCGNVFADGENGCLWTDDITDTVAIEQIGLISAKIKKDCKTRKKIVVTLFKEFWPESVTFASELKEQRFTEFNIDVNMVLYIHPDWKTMDDFLFSMKTKFRTKANAVYKRSNDLVLKSFSYSEINKHEERIRNLFKNVVDKSDYGFGALDAITFSSFKKALGEAFSFRAAFYNDELVGFSTAFFHKGVMEANYVGMDYEVNKDLAVYQRLLYDYVEQALERQVLSLQFGRTSELLKSSLGAEPVHMTLYAKHKATIPNIFMASVLSSVKPRKYELRKPFKLKFLEEWIR